MLVLMGGNEKPTFNRILALLLRFLRLLFDIPKSSLTKDFNARYFKCSRDSRSLISVRKDRELQCAFCEELHGSI